MVNNVLATFLQTIPSEDLESRVAKARGGDCAVREGLIRDYTPFVIKTAATVSKRYLTVGRDEEVSVALLAFDEAISAYSSPKPGFLAFAATVIRRRLIDHFRRQSRWDETPFSALAPSDFAGTNHHGREQGTSESRGVDNRLATGGNSADWQLVLERRDEVGQWKRSLAEFGFNLTTIEQNTPRHVDARKRALRIAEFLARDPFLRQKFLVERKLPVGDLLERLPEELQVSRKTIMRQREYITATALIFVGDFPSLLQFLNGRLAE